MYDTGTTAFMIICAMLVFLMTPALSLFYGGLARRKNVVNTIAMSFAVIGVVGVVWILCGWSFAYGGDGSIPFFGGFDQLGCLSITSETIAAAGDGYGEVGSYPGIIDIAFQAAFAIITMAIITGSLAGRMRFGAMVLFMALWCAFIYAPLAHMVWGGDGSLIGDMIGALDFAGGDVVHISSGVAGLVLVFLMGRRKGFRALSFRAHNIPMSVVGAGLLWFGWFGFNGGSEFAADGVAGLAFLNTIVAPCAAMLSWMLVERCKTGKPTLVGMLSGVVAGLVVITPAAGFVEPWAAILMGFIVSPCCYFAISYVKTKIGYDDALDAFGLHGVGGIVGGLLTGLFCVPELSWTDFGGLLYTGDASLLIAQVIGILITLAFVIVGTLVVGGIVKLVFGGRLKATAEEESMGMDAAMHNESAYPAFNGLD